MFERQLKNQLVRRWKTARSIYLFGPRQSGKTTLARTTFPALPYFNLEDPDVLDYVQSDPRGFLSQFPRGGIIDEPQRSAHLFSYLQGQIDLEKKKFLLTSSQNFLTMESISQSLAGRITFLNLFPFTKREIDRKPITDLSEIFLPPQKPCDTLDKLYPYILKGGYPEIHEKPGSFEFWHSDYVKTYLERDVRRIINVQDLSVFQRFIKLCAGRTGNLLNKASLAADCGISEKSCTRWLSLLEQSGIIVLLKPYLSNLIKRQTKSPKLFFMDTGLCCFLLGIKTTSHLNTHPLIGSLIETYVISEIYKNMLNQGIEPECYFWRDQHGNEIDLVLTMPNGQIVPIEIKAGQTINGKMFNSLEHWCKIAKVQKGILLYGGSEYQRRKNIDVLPISHVI